jgi:indolepyruvate ferredoxin oxidoreductase, alpha subunit
MSKILALGNEAVAMGAIDAGISGVYAYPGTPSTEITEYLQNSHEARESHIKTSWSVNEKTAYEEALGMSYAGKRSMVCMKHVGLNVAADAFINSTITGVNGGLVLVVADDPSMHSSQNEQDSRFYAKFAMLPVLEPSDQQEAYEMVRSAFTLSEEVELPVMLRLTTRISHSRAGIERQKADMQNKLHWIKNKNRFILLPVNARNQYQSLLDKQDLLKEKSGGSAFNKTLTGRNRSMGVIAFGLGYNYSMEVRTSHNLDFPVLKIGQYPLNYTMINSFFDTVEKILVVEEGYPIYEELFRGFFNDNRIIHGKLDGFLPRTGELNPTFLARALGISTPSGIPGTTFELPVRPPALCQGCSHRDVFEALNEIMDSRNESVFSDIGCYTLGALPPYQSISTCVDMGASVSMAKGAADAGVRPAIAVIGDSTFTHSGITGLLDAVHDQSAITVIISDNSTTAMTGGQQSTGKGKYQEICIGLGIAKEHIRILNPLKKFHADNVAVLREEFGYEGVSVIIAQRECIQTLSRKKKIANTSSTHTRQ